MTWKFVEHLRDKNKQQLCNDFFKKDAVETKFKIRKTWFNILAWGIKRKEKEFSGRRSRGVNVYTSTQHAVSFAHKVRFQKQPRRSFFILAAKRKTFAFRNFSQESNLQFFKQSPFAVTFWAGSHVGDKLFRRQHDVFRC